MKFLEALAKIPMRRTIVITLLALLAFAAFEHFPWAQSWIEHWSNMEALK